MDDQGEGQGEIGTYIPTTVYLTRAESEFLNREVGLAMADQVPLSKSDFMRLALDRLMQQLDRAQLREAVIEHVKAEAVQYPGRRKQGMPG